MPGSSRRGRNTFSRYSIQRRTNIPRRNNTSQAMDLDVSEILSDSASLRGQGIGAPVDEAIEAEITSSEFDSTMPDRDSSSMNPMNSVISTAVDQTGPQQRSLEELISVVLPAELKVMVLKHLVRMWATKIPLASLKCNPCYNRHQQTKEFYKEMNRAVLAYISMPRNWRRKKHSQGGGVTCHGHLGWCAIPAGPMLTSRPDFGSIETPGNGPYQVLSMASTQISKWSEHPIRIANILTNTTYSKNWHPIMESFFFGHMIWEFQTAGQFAELTRGMEERGSRKIFDKIKNISLEIYDPWSHFTSLLETIVNGLKDNIFAKLESLELHGNLCWLKCYKQGVVFETLRIRYLVTRCYQLIQLFPRLTICLKGLAYYHLARADESEYPERLEQSGFGFTEEEMVQFEEGTLQEIQNLPSLDFQIEQDRGGFRRRVADSHWKIKFAQEWKKILDQGIDSYDTVFDSYTTHNNR